MKVVLSVLALAAFASAGIIGLGSEHHGLDFHHGHELHHGHHEIHHDYYAPPHYDFEYKVHDGHSGDVKNHHEERVGDKVKGSYSHHQPDGTILEVHYTADKHNGYNAHVTKHGKSIHPEPQYHHHHHHYPHHH